ncbi:MAG: hypothetical protein JJU11_11160 [Candidatus Sumerlaeia bacterium]|nr:hypothetical protein [Candidatus Sumerlaeia bacterium]
MFVPSTTHHSGKALKAALADFIDCVENGFVKLSYQLTIRPWEDEPTLQDVVIGCRARGSACNSSASGMVDGMEYTSFGITLFPHGAILHLEVIFKREENLVWAEIINWKLEDET